MQAADGTGAGTGVLSHIPFNLNNPPRCVRRLEILLMNWNEHPKVLPMIAYVIDSNLMLDSKSSLGSETHERKVVRESNRPVIQQNVMVRA
jgi:hypothetical protein